MFCGHSQGGTERTVVFYYPPKTCCVSGWAAWLSHRQTLGCEVWDQIQVWLSETGMTSRKQLFCSGSLHGGSLAMGTGGPANHLPRERSVPAVQSQQPAATSREGQGRWKGACPQPTQYSWKTPHWNHDSRANDTVSFPSALWGDVCSLTEGKKKKKVVTGRSFICKTIDCTLCQFGSTGKRGEAVCKTPPKLENASL